MKGLPDANEPSNSTGVMIQSNILMMNFSQESSKNKSDEIYILERRFFLHWKLWMVLNFTYDLAWLTQSLRLKVGPSLETLVLVPMVQYTGNQPEKRNISNDINNLFLMWMDTFKAFILYDRWTMGVRPSRARRRVAKKAYETCKCFVTNERHRTKSELLKSVIDIQVRTSSTFFHFQLCLQKVLALVWVHWLHKGYPSWWQIPW